MSLPTSAAEPPALSPHLAERARALNDAPVSAAGEFVLCWLHHAVRGHENPVLSAALELGNALDLPVLVYQGLGGQHPYNNDRHHTFILEGARAAHADIAARGVRAVFHLDPTGRQPSPLQALAQRAAVCVVEDYPAPPFPAWSQALAARAGCTVLALDAVCVVPMRLQPRRFARAFEFRKHNAAAFAERVPRPWPEVQPQQPPFAGALGFAPLDLPRLDIAACVGACAIDHSVAPVAHTRGGSVAGYARWATFRAEGLAHYDRDRNDAAVDWPHGVSRISPYLHHGHVSPLKIARDAAATGGDSAEKFLDELLIWRELAFTFCYHTAEPRALACLPEWAQRTLAAHAGDPREPVITDEALARSRTGDPLWDLAQTALRQHGELHNNLRMTWAKAIVGWRPDPASALTTLLELNNRYALDGSDPNSYGGLLWALGLFDRPFPEGPVLGQLRKRSTRAHAKRLDLQHYARKVVPPAAPRRLRVGVIGAGLAGLMAARTLQDQGHRVQVLEKSRGYGGRAATRRGDGVSFDHGAQFFRVRDAVLQRDIAAWQEAGVVAPWRPRLARWQDGELVAQEDRLPRYVACPGMNALGAHLAADLTVHCDTRVEALERCTEGWRLQTAAGPWAEPFDRLVVALPAPQAAALLTPVAPELAAQAAAISYAPCWTAMVAFTAPVPLAVDAIEFAAGALGWAARDASKPGRGGGETWVLQAAPAWSSARLGGDRQTVAAELLQAFAEQLALSLPPVAQLSGHSWLYALAQNPLGTGALWDAERGIAVCGDWCVGARVEGAMLSGRAAAGYLLRAAHQADDSG